MILEGNPSLRDIYSMALTSALADIPQCSPETIMKLTSKLLSGIKRNNRSAEDNDFEVKEKCLNILTALLKRFGNMVEPQHESIMGVVLAQLAHPKGLVQKKATKCIGELAVLVQDILLTRLVESLLQQIELSGKGGKNREGAGDTRTLIQTIGTVGRTAGVRLGAHLDRIIPLFLSHMGDVDDEDLHTDSMNEVRENIFQAFESFVLHCPRQITSYLDTLLDVTMIFMKLDPNYVYDSDDDLNGSSDDEDSDEDDDYDMEYDDDDDDSSWKVRRAALKVLLAVISTRPELLSMLYRKYGDVVIGRFKEREESVRLYVIECMKELLRVTRGGSRRGDEAKADQSAPKSLGDIAAMDIEAAPRPTKLTRQDSAQSHLSEQIPSLISHSIKQLKSKSIKTRIAIIQMLKELVNSQSAEGGVESSIQPLMFHIDKCLSDSNSSLKLEGLSFLRLLLQVHKPAVLQEHIALIVKPVVQCVEEEWYKVISEALRVVKEIAQVIRPMDPDSGVFFTDSERGGSFDYSETALQLYAAVFPRFKATDIDQQIKARAIDAMGTIVSHFGDVIESVSESGLLPLFMSRLRNEITRMPTLKALIAMVSSSLQINVKPILGELVDVLSSFLRQQQRVLKQTVLDTLNALTNAHGADMSEEAFVMIISEVAPLIDDSDMHLAHLSIRLCVTCVRSNSVSHTHIQQHILPRALAMSVSPLMLSQQGKSNTGQALRSVLSFFAHLVQHENSGNSRVEGLDFNTLLERLMSGCNNSTASKDIEMKEASHDRGSGGGGAMASSSSGSHSGVLPRQSVGCLSQCIATICINTSETNRQEAVSRFLHLITAHAQSGGGFTDGETSVSSQISQLQLALLSLGAIGCQCDLARAHGDGEAVHLTVLSAFSFDSEDVRSVAAQALGSLSIGNPDFYFPIILEQLSSGCKQQYLLLSSLKEAIGYSQANETAEGQESSLLQHFDDVLKILFTHCRDPEEGVRNMVAECLGNLSKLLPDQAIPALAQHIEDNKSSSADGEEEIGATFARWTIVTSIKYLVIEKIASVSSTLSDHIHAFLGLLEDKDLNVRKAAILSLNSIAHHQPALISGQLRSNILPMLYNEMVYKEELRRVVDLGPFKHKVDDGLPLRKAAFTCMLTFLDNISERISVNDFMQYLIMGFSDNETDVQMLCHQILPKLCTLNPHILVESLDVIMEPLERTIMSKPRKGATINDIERLNATVRSALRGLESLGAISAVYSNRKYTQMLDRINKHENLRAMMRLLRSEVGDSYGRQKHK